MLGTPPIFAFCVSSSLRYSLPLVHSLYWTELRTADQAGGRINPPGPHCAWLAFIRAKCAQIVKNNFNKSGLPSIMYASCC